MVLGIPVEHLLTVLAGAAVGLTGHVFAKVSEIREQSDSSMIPWRYFALAPYKTGAKAMTVFLAALYVSKSIDWAKDMAALDAFSAAAAIGYAADSAINHLKR